MTKMKIRFLSFILTSLTVLSACRSTADTNQNIEPPMAALPSTTPTVEPTPALPNLQAEILDDRDKTSTHPTGAFDFKDYTYELPRGWQNPDGTTEITLTNGKVAPVSKTLTDDASNEARIEAKTQRRIGMTYFTAKYLDVTGDGQHEAIVILKVETGGSAIPLLVYIFTWNNTKPELIWNFRTGDRADGGLKDIRSESGELVVELYGQDRFLLGQTETGKITGDEEQLCCPTFFTRTQYKWNGNVFLMQGKRLTYSLADPAAPPIANMGDIVNKPTGKK